MRYYKSIINGYFVSVGVGGLTGEEITESEYNEIICAINNMPNTPEGCGCRLKEDLTYEIYDVPVAELDEEAAQSDYQSALAEMGVKV